MHSFLLAFLLCLALHLSFFFVYLHIFSFILIFTIKPSLKLIFTNLSTSYQKIEQLSLFIQLHLLSAHLIHLFTM